MKTNLKRFLLSIGIISLTISSLYASGKKPVQYNEDGDIIKTGWNLGPLPVVAFDNDRGFQYGALLNLYNFDDGSTQGLYPTGDSTYKLDTTKYHSEDYSMQILNRTESVNSGTAARIPSRISRQKRVRFSKEPPYLPGRSYAVRNSWAR